MTDLVLDSDSINAQSAALNQQLEHIHQQIEANKQLKQALTWTLTPKRSGKQYSIHKLLGYCGPDQETKHFLDEELARYWSSPAHFQSTIFEVAPNDQQTQYGDPVLLAASNCLHIDDQTARMAILGRMWRLVFFRLHRRYGRSIDSLVQPLLSTWHQYTGEVIQQKLHTLLARGSRLECWIRETGIGAMLYMGNDFNTEYGNPSRAGCRLI